MRGCVYAPKISHPNYGPFADATQDSSRPASHRRPQSPSPPRAVTFSSRADCGSDTWPEKGVLPSHSSRLNVGAREAIEAGAFCLHRVSVGVIVFLGRNLEGIRRRDGRGMPFPESAVFGIACSPGFRSWRLRGWCVISPSRRSGLFASYWTLTARHIRRSGQL